MNDIKIILDKIKKWSLPYSPINGIDPNQIERDMQTIATDLSYEIVDELFNEVAQLKGEMLNNLTELLSIYIRKNPSKVGSTLINRLDAKGPSEIIDLIGFTHNPDLFKDVVSKIDYQILNKEAKFSLFNTLEMLRNKQAISYLDQIKKQETDDEILEDIDIVMKNIADR